MGGTILESLIATSASTIVRTALAARAAGRGPLGEGAA